MEFDQKMIKEEARLFKLDNPDCRWSDFLLWIDNLGQDHPLGKAIALGFMEALEELGKPAAGAYRKGLLS